MPRRSAERRGRPQADVRGNAAHPWRSPHWPRTRMRSSEVPVRILPFAPFGAPPPLIFWRQTLSCSGLPRLGRKKRVARTGELVIASGAKQSRGGVHRLLDCFVAALLAMTAFLSAPARRGTPQNSLANFVGTPSRGGGPSREAKWWKGSSLDAWFPLQELRCGQRRRRHRFTIAARVSSRPAPPPPS